MLFAGEFMRNYAFRALKSPIFAEITMILLAFSYFLLRFQLKLKST